MIPSPELLSSCQPAVKQPESLYACLRQTANCELQTDTLLTIAQDFSPRVMRVSEQEILLDVSGLGRLIGEPPAIAAALARALAEAGLAHTARVAIAPTQTAARLLATQLPDYPITRLPDIPVTLLQPLETLPPAINHRDRARPYETRDAKRLYEILARWGIVTLGDLVALPAAELSSRLGRRGVALQRLARGLDPRPFVPDADTPRYIGRLELEWPLEAIEPLSFVFARLLDPLSAALERADRGAAAIRMDLRLTDRSTHTRMLQLPAPMRDPRVLRTLLLLDLESHPPFGGASEGRREPPRSGGPSAQRGGGGAPPSEVMIDIVSIEIDPAPGRITQFSLLERAAPSPETLSTLTARLSALVGESRIGSAVLLDTHQPGAFVMERYAPESAVKDGEPPVGPTFRSGVPGSPPALRCQRMPPAIRVSVERGRPMYIAAARRGMPQGAVTQAAGPWRTSGGWWAVESSSACGPGEAAERSPAKPDRRARASDSLEQPRGANARCGDAGGGAPATKKSGVPLAWNKDEWDVALSSGAICRIFQDRTTERWFLEGTYD